jgi:hypothetical protein
VILDDATSEIYYAQLVEEESTRTVMAALREVIETQGLFCALYSDRGSHSFVTPKAGEKVDKHRITQVGRVMKDLGIQMIPAYSPQARGRSERSFGTWQGRLLQELRLAGITTREEANRFLRAGYMAAFNAQFTTPAAAKGTAFRRCSCSDLNWIFTVQTERVVAKDNTVTIAERSWQLEETRFRRTLAGQTVTIHEHLDGTVSVRWGPHVVGRFSAEDRALPWAAPAGRRGKGGSLEAGENGELYLQGREQLLVERSGRTRMARTSGTRSRHDVELFDIQLALRRTVVVLWEPESEVKAANGFATDRYTKDYDAVVTSDPDTDVAKWSSSTSGRRRGRGSTSALVPRWITNRSSTLAPDRVPNYELHAFLLHALRTARRRTIISLVPEFVQSPYTTPPIDARTRFTHRLEDCLNEAIG